MSKALIIVDLQNDFCPGGALAVPDGDAIIPQVNKIITHAVQLGWLVIITRDWHPTGAAHFKEWPVHCVQNTHGAELHPDVQVPKDYVLITKGTSMTEDHYSPFQGTDSNGRTLAGVLHAHNVKTLYVTGLATDYCVKACVLDAQEQGFETVVLADAVRAVNIHPTDEYEAMLQMRAAYAHVTDTQEVLYETE